MPKFNAKRLKEVAEKILKAAGASKDKAQLISKMLVDGNLAGHDSHGVIRINQYINQIKSGVILPDADPELEVDNPGFGKVNGNRSFGQVAATYAMEICIEKAKKNGFAMVGGCNMAHIGRLSDYVSMASREDLLSFAFCNGGGPNVAPYGSRKRVFGTNPVAFAVPVKKGADIQADFASASTAEGKLNVTRKKGERVKEGLIINNKGLPTVDPNEFYSGGAILPIGGHKGSALSLMLEIFGGIFTGGRCSAFDDYIDGNGVLFFAMKSDLFRDRNNFDRDISLLQKAVEQSEGAPDFDRIVFPGQKEQDSYNRLKKEGIALDDNTWTIIKEAAQTLDVEIE